MEVLGHCAVGHCTGLVPLGPGHCRALSGRVWALHCIVHLIFGNCTVIMQLGFGVSAWALHGHCKVRVRAMYEQVLLRLGILRQL